MIAVITTSMLVFTRFGALLAMAPMFSARGIPRHVPILSAVLLTLLVTPHVQVAAAPSSLAALLVAMAGEIGMGVVIGGAVRMVFGAVAMASEMMAMEMGLGNFSLLNPLIETQEGPLGTLSTLLAAIFFIETDLHLVLLQRVADSFDVAPPGTVSQVAHAAEPLADLLAQSFSLGFQLAGPVLLYTWMINLFIALLTKLAPRMNVYFSIGIGLGSPMGIAILAFSLPWVLYVHQQRLAEVIGGLTRMIRGMA
ncbi:MAG: flagellar biosynthetic protein FliR [Deltaproteobacteria bacterium]|nr:flagellar biosynthetic protein FliR [Deltaproteobacteria bacterium]